MLSFLIVLLLILLIFLSSLLCSTDVLLSVPVLLLLLLLLLFSIIADTCIRDRLQFETSWVKDSTTSDVVAKFSLKTIPDDGHEYLVAVAAGGIGTIDDDD